MVKLVGVRESSACMSMTPFLYACISLYRPKSNQISYSKSYKTTPVEAHATGSMPEQSGYHRSKKEIKIEINKRREEKPFSRRKIW